MQKLKSSARISDVDSVSDALVRKYHEETSLNEDAYLAQLFTRIETLSVELTTAIKRDKLISQLDEADSVRDELIRQISTLRNGYAASPVERHKTSAKTAQAVFKKYGLTIIYESYARESSLITSMLEDYEQEPVREATFRLEGVRELIDNLRRVQTEFNAVYDAYADAKAVKTSSATSIKKPLIAIINDKLIPYLTVMMDANPEQYVNFAAQVESRIELANASIGRKGKTAEQQGKNE